jgi:S-adenosyl-L-methionine hydrolase (adenosine-forming)
MGSAGMSNGSFAPSQLVLFTDYGWQDPYVGQVKTVMAAEAPGVALIDLLHGVPDFNAHAGAQLLAAMAPGFPLGCVFFCVVDPGVGAAREALVVEADGRWFVGPDNGLLSIVAARARKHKSWHIHWRPEGISDSFHGRDLFAPIAAWIAAGKFPSDKLRLIAEPNIQFDAADLPRILYIDHYGNAWTGIRGGLADPSSQLEVKGKLLPWRRVFAEAGKGELFWHQNSVGLIEIAANRANAAAFLGLKVGDLVKLTSTNLGPVH